MPKVNRNYEHVDFSYLLAPAQGREDPSATPSKTQRKSDPPVVSDSKRRRDSLMSNQRMKFAISKASGLIHDRDCPLARKIKNGNYDMLETLPTNHKLCSQCQRMVYIRNGLAWELQKYAGAAKKLLDRGYPLSPELKTLFFDARAEIYRVEQDSVYIKAKEDRWRIEPVRKNSYWLYHNNYVVGRNAERIFRGDFHPQFSTPVRFATIVECIVGYTWEGHLKWQKDKEQNDEH